MEHKRILYDFCPKCSGLMKNGICIACGYGKEPEAGGDARAEGVARPESDGTGVSSHPENDDAGGSFRPERDGAGGGSRPDSMDGARSGQSLSALQTPERKKNTGIIALLFGIALVFVLIFVLAISLIVTDVRKKSSQSRTFSQKGASSEDAYSEYVPDASDEYYVEIVDYLRDDLAYQVEWQEDEEVERCSIYKEGYVTYMDEDAVSVVFLEYIYLNSAYLPRISDINIDVRTGSVLKHGSMVDYVTALAQRVRKQNAYQNSVDIGSMPWSDEDIALLLQSEEGVAFYTPVGLEVGFNYSSSDTGYGWLTVTLKE